MPIHDLGYRSWPGKYSSDFFRFWVISASGIRVVARNKWLRRMLLAAWLPTVGLAVIIFGYERMLENRDRAFFAAEIQGSVFGQLGDVLGDADVVMEALSQEDPQRGRHLMWSWLLSSFLRVPQAVMTMLVIGMIAPPLIARDMRTRAFLMYFSKPIGRYEYVLGKMMIVSVYLVFITTAPALGCYCFGVALSNDLSVVLDTWDLPLRVLLASLVFIVPAVSISLMFSSLTSESRFAGFAWFAFWGLGFIAWNVTYTVMIQYTRNEITEEMESERALEEDLDDWIDQAIEQSVRAGVLEPSDVVEAPVEPTPGTLLTPKQEADLEVERHQYRRMMVIARDMMKDQRLRERLEQSRAEISRHPLSLVSLYDTLVRLQRWIFGLEKQWEAVLPSLIVTILVTIFAWFILIRRVSAPIRI